MLWWGSNGTMFLSSSLFISLCWCPWSVIRGGLHRKALALQAWGRYEFDPQSHVTLPGVVLHARDPKNGEMGIRNCPGVCWPGSLAYTGELQANDRPCFRGGRQCSWGGHQRLCSKLHAKVHTWTCIHKNMHVHIYTYMHGETKLYMKLVRKIQTNGVKVYSTFQQREVNSFNLYHDG